MNTTLQLKITPVTSIDDSKVISQLPKQIRKDLGKDEGSGFDLRTNKRDLLFANGYVRYMVNEPTVDVFMD